MERFTIIGGGLVGTLQAVFLAQRGYKIDIYEKRQDPGSKGYVGGRSINLALSERGWRALEKVGLRSTIESIALPMHGRMMHGADGSTHFQAYGKPGQAIYSVSRSALNVALIEAARAMPNVQFSFQEECLGVDRHKKTFLSKHQPSGTIREIAFEHILSTDGAYSAVRDYFMHKPRFNYEQAYIGHGYKELSMPSTEEGKHALDASCLHIWPRKDFMMIALPNPDGTFTCTLFLAFEGQNSFKNIETFEAFETFFKHEFPDAYSLFPNLKQEFEENPVSTLMTVKCYPWNDGDQILLMGDAAHAIVPFYGQGMNCGFEDCMVFDQLIDQEKENWKRVFERFSTERKPDADAILELALQNFIEMRDLVGDPRFLLRKKIEAAVHAKYPTMWIPLYSQVTFSPEIPYSLALENGNRQKRIMDEVMQITDIEERWNDEKLHQEIIEKIMH